MRKLPNETGGAGVADVPRRLVARWFPSGAVVFPLAGGFSGSPIVLVRAPGHCACVLKSFPEGTDRPHAEWIHDVVRHLRAGDLLGLVPARFPATDGTSIVESDDGRLWEMAAYVDGYAVASPSQTQMRAAMQAIARVHDCLASLATEPPRLAQSRGFAERLGRARLLLSRPWRTLLTTPSPKVAFSFPVEPLLARACDAFDAHGGTRILDHLVHVDVPSVTCQVVLRDIWNEHILFDPVQASRIAAILDVHAMGIDAPATDLARLLGSWLPCESSVAESWWQNAIDAYGSVRPLGSTERQLVPVLAATSIVFGLDNWFRWTLEEGRTFSEPKRVLSRIERLVDCLPPALKTLTRTT